LFKHADDTSIEAAKVPGWIRLKAAQDWLERNARPAEPKASPDFGAVADTYFEKFQKYLDQKHGGRTPRTSAEFHRLYGEFLSQNGLN
jgi:predicted nucleotidyltransferase